MFKKIIIIILLIAINICSYIYLKRINIESDTFIFSFIHKPIIVKFKDIEIENTDNFDYKNYITVLSINEYHSSSSFDKDCFTITVNNGVTNSISFPYELIEKEVEKEVVVKEKIVYQDRVIEKSEYNKPQDPVPIIEEDYFVGYHDVTLKLNTDIHTLVYEITKDVKTNMQVTIDYAAVNLSYIGTYPVYYYVKDQTYSINVFVIEG